MATNERPRRKLQAETELSKAEKQAEIIMNNAITQAKILNNKYFENFQWLIAELIYWNLISNLYLKSWNYG